MRHSTSQTKLFLTPIIAILGIMAFTQALPAVASSTATPSTGAISGCGSNNEYGCTYWWDWSLIGNAIPGQTVYFAFNLYNTAPSGNPVTMDTLKVQTPWANYTDPALPMQVDTGYSYYNGISITIPANQAPGSVFGSLQFTGEFSDSTPWCSSTGDVCSDSATFPVVADPAILQTQIASLNAQVSTLTAQTSSFQGQVNSLNTQISALTSDLSQANGNLSTSKQTIATDQAALTQAQSDLTTAKASLASAQAQLASNEAQLTSSEAELASTQSSLNSTSGVYLPLAAAIPAIVAALFAVLYFKKKSVATPAH